MVQVKVKFVGLDPRGEQRVVVLEEFGGDRYFTMSVNVAEAQAISAQLEGIPAGQRPMMHEIVLIVLRRFGGRVSRVVIDEPRYQRYTATIDIEGGPDNTPISCRPTDGIAIAMVAGAPIYVTPDLAPRSMRRLPRHPRPPNPPPPSVG